LTGPLISLTATNCHFLAKGRSKGHFQTTGCKTGSVGDPPTEPVLTISWRSSYLSPATAA
jgi:hypothetical protein